MLTYRNDPLVLEKETANDLIRDGKLRLLFLDKNREILNLYSALVKSRDFLTKGANQSFRRSVYANGEKLANKVKALLPENLIPFKKILSEYVQHKNPRQLYNLSREIYGWIEKEAFPLPFLRCLAHFHNSKKLLIKFFNLTEFFTEQRLHGKIIIPKTGKELANPSYFYLAGCSFGDGNIGKYGRKWQIADGSENKENLSEAKEFIKKIKVMLNKRFSLNFGLNIEFKRNAYILEVHNKTFCRFLNFFFALSIGRKKKLNRPLILDLVDNKKKDLESAFWRGLFDTDGSIDKGSLRISLSSTIEQSMEECKRRLETFGLRSKVFNKKNQRSIFGVSNKNELHIYFFDIKRFAETIGFAHPRKQKILVKHLKKGPKETIFYGINKSCILRQKFFDLSKIENIRLVNAGELLRKLRIDLGLTQFKLGKLFGKWRTGITKWENNKESIPLDIFIKIVHPSNLDKERLYKEILKRGVIFRIKNSKSGYLPLIVNRKVIKIAKFVRPCISTFSSKLTFRKKIKNEFLTNQEYEKLKETFENMFKIELKHNHYNYYTQDKLICSFFDTFFLYNLPWQPVSSDVSNYTKKWNDVWCQA